MNFQNVEYEMCKHFLDVIISTKKEIERKVCNNFKIMRLSLLCIEDSSVTKEPRIITDQVLSMNTEKISKIILRPFEGLFNR